MEPEELPLSERSSEAASEKSPPQGTADADARIAASESTLTRRIVGFFFGVLACFFIAAGASCVQILDGAVPDFELSAIRGAAMFWGVIPYYIIVRRWPSVNRASWIWMVLYSIFDTSYQTCIYVAVRFIPVGLVGCVYRTTMMLYILILARIILKEIITVVKFIGVVLSIIGVFLVVQPEVIFGKSPSTKAALQQNLTISAYNSSKISLEEEDTAFNNIMGYSMTIIAAFSYGSLTITQKAKLPHIHPMDVGFFAAIPKMLVPLVLSLALEVLAFPSDTFRIMLVLGQAVASTLVSLLNKQATSMTTAILVSLAMSFQVIFMLVAQYTVLRHIQPGHGNWIEVVGAIAVAVGVILPPLWEVFVTKYLQHRYNVPAKI